MRKLYCPYCGELIENGCNCEAEAAEAEAEFIEQLEERQHKNGFYAFQDMIEMYRNER